MSDENDLAERYREALDRLLALQNEATLQTGRIRAAERDADEARRGYALQAAELERLRLEADSLRREVARRRDELARCTEALRAVVESASWRLTRPLRRLTGSTRPERV